MSPAFKAVDESQEFTFVRRIIALSRIQLAGRASHQAGCACLVRLGQCGAEGHIACINVQDERLGRIREREANAVDQGLLQSIERGLLGRSPRPGLIFVQQTGHWFGNVLKIRHKALVKTTKSEETTDVFWIGRCWPILDRLQLVWVRTYPTVSDNEANVFNFVLREGTLTALRVQFLLAEAFQYEA